MPRVSYVVIFLALTVGAFSQPSQPSNLAALEETIARQFNDLRVQAGLKPLQFRRDLRLRKEACSLQVKGPDNIIERPSSQFKSWYLAADPTQRNDELARIALTKIFDDHVAVGVWFAKTDDYPNGMYWVVLYPEHGAAHEAFWSHFYLTDDFEYQTPFGKKWTKRLPAACRSIK